MHTQNEIDNLSAERSSRRSLLRALGGGALAGLAAVAAPALAADSGNPGTPGAVGLVPRGAIRRLSQASDYDILNYILQLKYLEATYYSIAATGRPLAEGDLSGVGVRGETFGGQQVMFEDNFSATLATQLATDTRSQVRSLRQLLGSRKTAKAAINLDVIGGFESENQFMAVGAAYTAAIGAAIAEVLPFIRNHRLREVVGRILNQSGGHLGALNVPITNRNIGIPLLGPGLPRPLPGGVIPNDPSDGLPATATVTDIVTGLAAFYPRGLNGRIR